MFVVVVLTFVYGKKMKKLPKIITQEEFEKMFSEAKKMEEKTKSKVRKKRIKEYRIAMLLGFEAGMRISEIVGFKDIVPKLIKNKVDNASIRIDSGKGNKDRIVPKPKRLNQTIINMLPLSLKRRSLQVFIEKLGKDVLNKKISFHCVDKDTEILTVNGWKKYNKIKNGDNIFTYNVGKDFIEIKKIKEIFSRNYHGDMYHIKNKYIDSLVTPEHKIISKYSRLKMINKKRMDIWNSNQWSLISLNEILSKKSLRQIKYKLSSVYVHRDEDKNFTIGKDKAGILGWILSDGCIGKDNITIHQSISANPIKCEIISDLLEKSGIPYSKNVQKEIISGYNKKKRRMIVFRILKGNDNKDKWIFKFINKDRTPNLNEILKLHILELEEIYINMMLGDGNKNFSEYCGQNKKRIELIRIICYFLNKRTLIGFKKQNNKKYFRTYITNRDYCDIHRNIKKITYNGIVWCPSTDNGTFIAKRNDKIFLTGNTLRHGFGTHLANKGRPLHEIQMLMGHSNLATTSIYLHADPKVAIDKAREVF